jgi:hypothetical protein
MNGIIKKITMNGIMVEHYAFSFPTDGIFTALYILLCQSFLTLRIKCRTLQRISYCSSRAQSAASALKISSDLPSVSEKKNKSRTRNLRRIAIVCPRMNTTL